MFSSRCFTFSAWTFRSWVTQFLYVGVRKQSNFTRLHIDNQPSQYHLFILYYLLFCYSVQGGYHQTNYPRHKTSAWGALRIFTCSHRWTYRNSLPAIQRCTPTLYLQAGFGRPAANQSGPLHLYQMRYPSQESIILEPSKSTLDNINNHTSTQGKWL